MTDLTEDTKFARDATKPRQSFNDKHAHNNGGQLRQNTRPIRNYTYDSDQIKS